MPRTNTHTHIVVGSIDGNITPMNYYVNMTVSSQVSKTVLQNTTHYAKSFDEVNAWCSLFEQYCMRATAKYHSPIYTGFCVCIKICKTPQTTVFCEEFKGLSRDDLNLWYDFFEEIAPEADERRL